MRFQSFFLCAEKILIFLLMNLSFICIHFILLFIFVILWNIYIVLKLQRTLLWNFLFLICIRFSLNPCENIIDVVMKRFRITAWFTMYHWFYHFWHLRSLRFRCGSHFIFNWINFMKLSMKIFPKTKNIKIIIV